MKQNKLGYAHGTVVNIYIVDELKNKTISNTDFTVQNGLFVVCRDISSDWSLTNSTKIGLYGNVYDFAVDYVPINGVGKIYDIHRYLMTKHNI